MLLQHEQRLMEKQKQLLPIEIDFCKWLKSVCNAEGLNTQLFTVKSMKTYCAIKCVAEVVRIKAHGKTPYILLPSDCPVPEGLSVSATTKSEGEWNKRVHFTEASDLYPMRDYFVERYRRAFESIQDEINKSVKDFQFVSETAALEISL